MTYPKFIITMDGYLRLGMLTLHKDLLKGNERCLGGGYFEIDYISNLLILDGKSTDFGPPLWHLLDNLKVPKDYLGLNIKYITCDIPSRTIYLKDEISIEYY